MPHNEIARALEAENLQPGESIGLKALCQNHSLSVSRMADFMKFHIAASWVREALQQMVAGGANSWLLDVQIVSKGGGRYRSWLFKCPYPGPYGHLVEALNIIFKKRKSPIMYSDLLIKIDSPLVHMFKADMEDKINGPQVRLYLLEFGYRCTWDKAKQQWEIC